ncbi:hypothetical protein TNCV_1705551 [Trichonephila clavipes]|uniref:Uncharacterized protein n=1 Tax=Trichonephila clavipes TaxID=2585209 RepID=A0A8X6V078_TRICX|nr:hypothetical protein TNCV_1705551 [Trichonephila clavipes]
MSFVNYLPQFDLSVQGGTQGGSNSMTNTSSEKPTETVLFAGMCEGVCEISFANPTSLAHADASRDVLPRGGTSQFGSKMVHRLTGISQYTIG